MLAAITNALRRTVAQRKTPLGIGHDVRRAFRTGGHADLEAQSGRKNQPACLFPYCLLSYYVRQKYQYIAHLWFMHPQTPRTSAHSDKLTPRSRILHPRFRGRHRVWTSYLDLAGYSCLKERRNAFKNEVKLNYAYF